MKAAVLKFIRDEEGATAIEYGIIAGLMAILLAAIFSDGGVVGSTLTAIFDNVKSLATGATGTGS